MPFSAEMNSACQQATSPTSGVIANGSQNSGFTDDDTSDAPSGALSNSSMHLNQQHRSRRKRRQIHSESDSDEESGEHNKGVIA